MRSPSRKEGSAPSAIFLLEQAVHLLRASSSTSLVIYYASSIPFVLGLLFFWAEVTWFAPAPASLAWSAVGLAALFAVMKTGHAEFCAHLLAHRLGSAAPKFDGKRLMRLGATQLRWQAWGLFLLPLSVATLIFFAPVYAFFQNISVLGEMKKLGRSSTEQAMLWPGQNCLGLLFLAGLSICAAVNLGATFWMLPWLANHVLGIENIFGFTGWWFANSTFVASVLALAWLAVDPLVKALYTLRVFYGRSVTSGDDLRVELAAAQRLRKPLRMAVLGLMALLAIGTERPVRAAESVSPDQPAVSSAQLDRAIDDVLAGQDFRWRLRPMVADSDSVTSEGPLMRFVHQGVDYLSDFGRWIWRSLNHAANWVRDFFQSADSDSSNEHPVGTSLSALQILLYLFLVAAILLIGIVIYLVIRRGRSTVTTPVMARRVKAAIPDLADEATHATQLPTDGWLKLAREQLARGEWRLAIRALQLAALTQLAEQGLIALGKSKTNLDYERELRRRALSRQDLVTRFSNHRRTFEAVWYGRTKADEKDARQWLAELEQSVS